MPAIPFHRVGRGILRAAAVIVLTASAGAQTRVNPDAQLSVDFLKRVQAYVDLHRKLESTLPPLPDKPTPAQVDTHQRALSRLIAQARSGAQYGDIFSREGRAYVRRQLARALSGPDSRDIVASIMDENPGRLRLQINGRYPDEIPLATMPPQILAALPKLPEDIEYRFIGDRLILLDVHAHLVVDFLNDALPR